MDPLNNPFSPGAGTRPPNLAGRDKVRADVALALGRVRRGLSAKSVVLVGLRGVGKTVLLDQMRDEADADGMVTLRIEAPEQRSLPSMLAPQLRISLLRMSRLEHAKSAAHRGLRALAGFVGKLKVTFGDIEVGLDMEPEPGLADNGDLQHDLQDLLEAAAMAAKAANTALVMFVDEMQYIPEPQLAALITALHRCAQRQLPIVLVGAGLPLLRGRMGSAKSYAERLFDFPQIGPLNELDARTAIEQPMQSQGVQIDADALDAIVAHTHRYPYFLQEWGKHVWDSADASPVSIEDVDVGSPIALAALDESFFKVRFDRLTPSEKRYLRAMAELGPGPHRSGDMADLLAKPVSSFGPVRARLIDKGMIWSPTHGDTAFTVPLFDEYMRRSMPSADWREL